MSRLSLSLIFVLIIFMSIVVYGCQKNYSIEIRCLEDGVNPMSGVTVTIDGTTNTGVDINRTKVINSTSTSDMSSLGKFPAGTYRISASKAGYNPQELTVTVTESKFITLYLSRVR
jgi:hypothetical protein